ncbi:MAG TPA: hypothetical protein ENJ45_05220 [Phaeodactylibacter sp.]|nr:hypothetical protein [Phaeodactylibacter sp.]
MPIITLTTDFGLKDYYVALVKAALLSKEPSLQIVDISHNVNAYDIVQGAFILKNCYAAFPKGTIHIVSISDYSTKKPCFLALRHDGHYFIGADNGLFSLLFENTPNKDIYEIDYYADESFPVKRTFAEAVAHLISSKPFNEIGIPIEAIEERITFQPVISKSEVNGTVIHIDHYGNAITNIRRDTFEQVGQGRPFALYFKRHDPILQLSNYYADVPIGEALCFFNAANCLEIAINHGNAAELFGLKVEDTIQVNFKES